MSSFTGPRFRIWSMCFRTFFAKFSPNVTGPLSKDGAAFGRCSLPPFSPFLDPLLIGGLRPGFEIFVASPPSLTFLALTRP